MIPEILIKRFQLDVKRTADRSEARILKSLLEKSKRVIFYPLPNKNNIFDTVLVVFSDKIPVYLERGEYDPDDFLKYTIDDDDAILFAEWGDIAPHMDGTIWIDSSIIEPPVLEPCGFDVLDNLPVLEDLPNSYLRDAVHEYMNARTNKTMIEVEKYIDSLPLEVLRISCVYSDIDTNSVFVRGVKTAIIYYKNEIICYASITGHELSNVTYKVRDMKKFQCAMQDIVDNMNLCDKIVIEGVTVMVEGEDVDNYLAIPGFSPHIYS